ncbi:MULTISPECIES: DNA mismatch repair endonuclease MutL [unclassified Apibacter]|uniref:DNA mismatch repair endonuclease MutL n=1 Tax=unclassified Apibacter TaxID=2630820 RepID=UPI0013271BCC|nr:MULTISPECIES: DNA mismatch repair endonuclease MutL [unclassified Apibacter]MCX8677560.1 DNA mismatch repair endonuclease MutL [Apibacter sp. B3919]MXO24236.1 DNA mismatch repair endonuclease MutL [Apibacter sp. B3924]MXO27025.1 DNA mismatch repair endonuclease MutL [Apibacter sp. B3813]MXO28848.1 DNA mismatch repair endonuclease MutL [Apibacter sp. B3913]MXO30799.1 DNA mismatch repair endonuclease MutL [Apibacter sp. B3912]
MPDIIHLLPDNVSNQIAAGEVVQRPSSVVKELLENAIDAKATQIQLIIKEAGRNLIQVVDNGVGMSVTDARMSFERHATSKISTTEDIFHIHTKGFRGEALASIAAVSQVELKTRKEEDELGTHIIIEGGDIISQLPVNTAVGSTFLIKNLFFNVPARRKFLKSNSVEFRHILDEFHRVALAHEDIQFQLFNNDEEMFRLRSGSLLQRISEIFGRKIQHQLIPIAEQLDWIKLNGFIGKPEGAKKARGEQFFFVNQRFFRSTYLNKAVQDAFEGLIPPRFLPSFFLYIQIDPERIDVNIHPTKTEIKFEDEASIYALLRTAIKKSLGVYNVVPSLDFDQNPDWSFSLNKKDTPVVEPKININSSYNPFDSTASKPSRAEKVNLHELYASSRQEILTSEMFDNPSETITESSLLRLSNGRWITEKDSNVWILDPYRIHQTVLYENHIKNSKGNVLSQQLLFPIERPVYDLEKEKLDSIKTALFAEGLDMEIEEDLLTITAIPSDVMQEKIIELIDYLLSELSEHSEEEFSIFFSKTISKVSARKRNEFIQPSHFLPIWENFITLGCPKFNPFGKRNYEILPMPNFD